MIVVKITPRRAMDMVITYHYSHRKVGSKYAFGLMAEDGDLLGCIVYSIPASYTLCKGVCGDEWKQYVLELSRLVVLTEEKNAASRLIGGSLRQLGNAVVVSYADTSHAGHVGYVYQATNWIYTGRGNAEPAWVDPRSGNIVSFTRRHIDLKAKSIGLDWHELIKMPQLGKHRYVTFTGSKKFKRDAKAAMRYKEQPYPKGPTQRHEANMPSDRLFH